MTLGATSKFVWVLVDSGYTIGHFDEQSCLLNNFKNINEWQHSAYHKRTPNPARCLGERCIRFVSGVWGEAPAANGFGAFWRPRMSPHSIQMFSHTSTCWLNIALSTIYRLSLRWDGEVRLPPLGRYFGSQWGGRSKSVTRKFPGFPPVKYHPA